MAEFISQSEPMTPPSIMPQITQSKTRSDPSLYMNNERNAFHGILLGAIILVLSIYLPLVMSSDSMKWVSLGLSMISLLTLFTTLYSFKRNLDALNFNEQEFIDWSQSSTLLYTIGGSLSVVSMMIMYELYWNASNSSKSKTHPKPIMDDDVKSVGSVRSIKSTKSGRSMSVDSLDSR